MPKNLHNAKISSPNMTDISYQYQHKDRKFISCISQQYSKINVLINIILKKKKYFKEQKEIIRVLGMR
jgi:short-subunit dehydrogenase involved in D-alanine esterification of teichoic acids